LGELAGFGSAGVLGVKGATAKSGNGVSSPERGELEDVVLECLLASPHRAGEILAEVTTDFFRDGRRQWLAQSIERQLTNGGFTAKQLLRDTDEYDAPSGPEGAARDVRGLLLDLLGRLESPDGNPSRDYEEVWKFARRDVERRNLSERVDELKRKMAHEVAQGDSERLLEFQREYFENIRRLKRPRNFALGGKRNDGS